MGSDSFIGRIVPNQRDWINIASALAVPIVFFYPFYCRLHGYVELSIYGVLLLIWVADLNYLLHLHVHRPFTTSNAFNRLIDLCLASVSGMTSANWRIQHVFGHHKGHDEGYTLRSLDWTMDRYSFRGALAYSFGNIAATFWGPIRDSFRKGILANVRQPIDYRSAFFEQIGFILFVVALAILRPTLTFAFLLPWYVIIFAMTRYVDYLNHYGCSDDGMNFANNSLSKSFNWRINNFGYHTAHHIDPSAHWTTLPQIHASIAGEIPPDRIKTFDWSSALLPYHAWCEFRARRKQACLTAPLAVWPSPRGRFGSRWRLLS